jgi:hypothetical protein
LQPPVQRSVASGNAAKAPLKLAIFLFELLDLLVRGPGVR